MNTEQDKKEHMKPLSSSTISDKKVKNTTKCSSSFKMEDIAVSQVRTVPGLLVLNIAVIYSRKFLASRLLESWVNKVN